jgi:DNA topoisomerase I
VPATPTRSRSAPAAPETPVDPAEAAATAGLRYVSDSRPGIRRRRTGKGFTYVGPDGKRVRDAATIERIRKLAIPPAYTDVWICPDPRGHLQATGRDARGRKQYRYHPKWREVRDETKFGRMIAFSLALPKIRRRVEADLSGSGLSRDKVLATIVRLLECSCIRVGNEEYARSNESFGLTTLKDDHVEVSGSKIRFEFNGKSGKTHAVDISDRRLAKIVAHCQSIPGEELFQYLDENGERQTVDSGDVNDYIRRAAGDEFTAKDFRTWAGTILAVEALQQAGGFASQREGKSRMLGAIDRVAEQLNNTRAVCRKYYIHPAVLQSYLEGTLREELTPSGRNGRRPAQLSSMETSVLALLRQHNGNGAAPAATRSRR